VTSARLRAQLVSGVLCAVALASCATPRAGQGAGVDAGASLFQMSCAGCHGTHADGRGAVAPLLRVPVPDLTHIAARRGGSFPDDEIYRIIDGQADLKAHGPRHMPVWGYEFFGADPDDAIAHREATQKVTALVAYLSSIQRAE